MYHGTDEESGQNIVEKGLSKRQWQQHVDEGGDPTGFSLTEDIAIARQHAAKSAFLRDKSKEVILTADEANLPPLAKGTATESFDAGESKILPEHINKRSVGPGDPTIAQPVHAH